MAGHYTLYIQGKYTPTPEEMHDWFGTPLPTTPTPTSTILPAPQQSFWTPTTTPPLTPQQQAEQTLMGQTTPQQQIAQSLGLQPSQINPVVNNAAINYNLTPTQALQQEASGGQAFPVNQRIESNLIQQGTGYSPEQGTGISKTQQPAPPSSSQEFAYQSLTGQLDRRQQVAQSLGVPVSAVNPVLGRPYQPVYPQGSVAERVAVLEGSFKKPKEWESNLVNKLPVVAKSSSFDSKSTVPFVVQGEKLDLVKGVGGVVNPLFKIPGYAKEVLIDVPGRIGVEAAKTSLKLSGGNKALAYALLPSVAVGTVAVKAGQGIVYSVSNPEKAFTGILEAATSNPIKFGTQTAITVLGFKGVGSIGGKALSEATVLGKSKGYIPSPKIVSEEVASGKKLFPTAKSPVEALKKFESEELNVVGGKKVVLHATDYPYTPFKGRTIKVTSGRGLVKTVDVPALYVSLKGVSTYFLRLKQGLSEYKLFPNSVKELLPNQPKILAISETPVRMPKAFRESLEKGQEFFGKVNGKFTFPKGELGKPYVTPALEQGLKNEAEAGIMVGSKFKRVGLKTGWEKLTGFSKYTRINGRIVPIYELEFIGKGVVSKGLVDSVKASDYSKYSSGVARRTIISPKVLVSSVRVSKVSSSVSKAGSGKAFVSKSGVSVVSSVKPKEVSFKASVSSSLPKVSSTSFAGYSSGSSVGSYSSAPSVVSSYSGGYSSFAESSYVPEISKPKYSSSSPSVKMPSYSPGPSISSPRPVKYSSYKLTPSIPKSRTYVPYSYVPKIPSYAYQSNYEFPPILSKLKKRSRLLKESSGRKLLRGYSVYSRRKGKSVKLGSNLPRNLALLVGKRFTGETVAKSFVVRPEGFTSQEDVALPGLFQYKAPKFGGQVYREGFKFVEKSKFAIDTFGEKQQLKLARQKSLAF